MTSISPHSLHSPHFVHDDYTERMSLTPSHPLSREFWNHIQRCVEDMEYCQIHDAEISLLIVKMSNEHASLLLHDRVQAMLIEAFYVIPPSIPLGERLSHILSVLYFSQGDYGKAKDLWPNLNSTDVTSMRSYAAQRIMFASPDNSGLESLVNYSQLLGERFYDVVTPLLNLKPRYQIELAHRQKLKEKYQNMTQNPENILDSEEPSQLDLLLDKIVYPPVVVRSYATPKTEDLVLEFLMNEAQGGVRIQPKLSDLFLSSTELSKVLTASLHFKIGLRLGKLSLYDLGQKHISIAATPWEPLHYRLRYILSLPPIYPSLRSLAHSIDNFELQIEKYLLSQSFKLSSFVNGICESFDQTSIVLGVLPLLHLTGYNAPRHEILMGYSPIPMPVLLSELYSAMCSTSSPLSPFYVLPPTSSQGASLGATMERRNQYLLSDNFEDETEIFKKETPVLLQHRMKSASKVRIGIISGSFDSLSGRIFVGMLEAMKAVERNQYELIAMCFPTPRDSITDRAKGLFHANVNLYSSNRTETVQRIRDTEPDIVIFADPGQDSRTFALAHYRLAPFQLALWGWGGTLGIPAIDFYIFPEVFWMKTKCVPSNQKLISPQELFSEQVMLLDGLPPIAKMGSDSYLNGDPDSWKVLQERLLLPPLNRSHLYLFPGSARHLHPEMDAAISILLKTDKLAIILFTSPLMGRDMLPPLHSAVLHDQLHPVTPTAACSKLRARLIPLVGDAISRLRFLPPIDDNSFHLLRSYVVAVLDPFPVGMHLPVLEALAAGVPVVSAPKLQECTNSHVVGISQLLQLQLVNDTSFLWPTTSEEYAVFAMRLARDPHLRLLFDPRQTHGFGGRITSFNRHSNHGQQLFSFCSTLRKEYV